MVFKPRKPPPSEESSDDGTDDDVLEDIKTMVEEGREELEIASEHFPVWCAYHEAISKFITLYKKG